MSGVAYPELGEHVRLAAHGACAIITIDRPEARNAVNASVARGIEAAIDRLEADPALHVGVLTGAGPVFCAGADMKAFLAGDGSLLSTGRGGFAGITERKRTKPLIAAVTGAALAGGAEVALSCDMIVAADDAVIGLPEVTRGLVPTAGGVFRLAYSLPLNVALEAVLTGEPLTATCAHHHGLVNHIAAPEKVLERAIELADAIIANGPLAVRESRRLVLSAATGEEERLWHESAAAHAVVIGSNDVQEGVRAFFEKRPPRWTGN